MNNKNEMGPYGRESDFRRDVRQTLDMHPLDRDEQIVAEVKRLKKLEKRLADFVGERSGA